MLTGEAVPVRKVSYSPAVDGLAYDPDVHKGCTLYGGTCVAQVRLRCVSWDGAAWVRCSKRVGRAVNVPSSPLEPHPCSSCCPQQVRPGGSERQALGVVCRTAFWTAKGQLMKSILFPRQHRQTFVGDALRFIAVMLLLGFAFYIWDVVALASYGAKAG